MMDRLDARALRSETGEGLRAILREPTALFFSVLMPVAFYALFTGVFGRGTGEGGLPYAVTSLAGYGAFGVVAVMLLNPGIGVAEDRTRGWLRVKKVSATPIGVVLAARVMAALPYAVGVLLAMSAVSVLLAGPVLDLGTWALLMAALLLGALPFALFGLAVGFVASSGTTAAVLNAVRFPMVLASGLWIPLELLPGFLQAIAPFLPTYHLARLAMAPLTGGPVLGPLLALLLTTAVGALLAGRAYRDMRV
ncbi:MAG: ABC transporter permease [Pseudonocardiales bacterium]|nr:ABC transporter permease [Pseudonocardiales bacterium]